MRRKSNKAHWIRHTHLFRADRYECSSCGYESETAYKHCPKCKKVMTGSDYDPSWVDELETVDAFFED